MARGFGIVKEHQEKIGDSAPDFEKKPSVLYLRLPEDGDTAIVRFLEQGDDVFSTYVHQVGDWRTEIPCLDQNDDGTSCPGCDSEFPRRLKAILNIIWRDAPVIKRDEDGRFEKNGNEYVIEGHEDQVAVWKTGFESLNALARKDVKYKGLSSRDFEITREGTGKKTKYSVEPADVDSGPVAPSAKDKKLAKDAYDPEEVSRPVNQEAFTKIIEKKVNDSEEDDGDDTSEFLSSSPFS